VIPAPLRRHDCAAGYWWELSMRQIEVSDTIVFDAPRRARAFYKHSRIKQYLKEGRALRIETV
jgi:hypothetical protein